MTTKTYKLGDTVQTNRVTRRQCEFAQSLAERTGSTIPTERQLLDYCHVGLMSQMIDDMKRGHTVIIT